MNRSVSIVVFTQANMNALDGSSVWTQSIALAFAGVDGVEVTLLLSHPIDTDRLLRPLLDHPDVSVVDPFRSEITKGRGPLPLDEAGRILRKMTGRNNSPIVVRGVAVAEHLARVPALRDRLWPYLTDIPQRAADVDAEFEDQISTIMAASPVVLCQTEELQIFLEEQFSSVTGKGWLVQPIIPDDINPRLLQPPTGTGLRLCYAGKFARGWKTLEMCDLPSQLSDRGINATLTMVGEKVNRDPDWPGYVSVMIDKLANSQGVDWVGGVSREQSVELMSSAHVGLSWRSRELDASLELSTKLLEYCAAGTPPLLNRTPMHERIFGADYPLFVDSAVSVLETLESLVKNHSKYQKALAAIADVADDFTMKRASTRLGSLVDRMAPVSQQGSWSRVWRRGRGTPSV